MISQELMDEIIYNSLKKQFISKELIEKIVLDVLSNCDETTQNIFGGLYFRDLRWDCMLAEVDEQCNINASYEKMIELADKDGKTYLEKNLELVSYLLHEIEHLKEDFKKGNNTFQSKIVELGCGEYIYDKLGVPVFEKVKDNSKAERIIDSRYQKFNEKNWGLIPCERIAEVTARKNIVESLINYPGYETKFFNEYKNLVGFYIYALKMEYSYRKYNNCSAPIYRFYNSLSELEELNNIISIMPKLTAEEKMMYGFPVKPIDLIEVNKMKIKGRR